MNKVKINLKKRQGSAIILTLVVVLLLTLLGVAAMGMSLGNLKMGARVEKSTEEYYGIDAIGEDVVGEIDLKLKNVEDVAIRYLRYELFASENVTKTEADGLDQEMANILYNGGHETSNKFAIKTYLPPDVHKFFYTEWKNNAYEPSKLGAGMDYGKYDKKMEEYYKEAFNRVYMYNAEKLLKDLNDAEIEVTEKQKVKETVDGKETVVERYVKVKKKYSVKMKKKKNKDYTLIGSGSNWKNYEFERDDFIAEISTKDKDGKTLVIELAITPPSYSSVSQIKTSPVFGSKAILNAVYASDLDIDGNKMAIIGDVIVKNKIDIKGLKEINIYGNLTAGSQITTTSEDKEVKVFNIKPYPTGFKQLYKDRLFGSNIFYEFDDDKLNSYIEKTETDYKTKPILIFKDNKGGNLIAGEVRFERLVKALNLNISNNALIKNNLILEAEKDTKVRIGKHLVMTNPYVDDKNSGSICFLTGLTNRIQLDGAIVIPGSYRGNIDERNYDFTSIENYKKQLSFTNDKLGELGAQFIDLGYMYIQYHDAYIKNEYDIGLSRNNSDTNIYGYSYSPMILNNNSKINYFLPDAKYQYYGSDCIPRSKYTLFNEYKTAIDKFDKQNFWNSYITRRTSGIGFKDLNMDTAFDITALKESAGYMDSSKTQVKVFKPGATFKLDEDFEGIVYGLGDLTIKGPRTIKGAVVVNGKLTLMGNTNIKYDETVLLEMQRKNKYVQAFLKPGEGPVTIDYLKEDTLSPKVRTATDGDRFKIKTWKIQ